MICFFFRFFVIELLTSCEAIAKQNEKMTNWIMFVKGFLAFGGKFFRSSGTCEKLSLHSLAFSEGSVIVIKSVHSVMVGI